MADPTLQSQWQQLVTGFAQRNGLIHIQQQQHFSLTERNGTLWSLHVPENSDLIHIHAAMQTSVTNEALTLALSLNNHFMQMRGAWLSLNPQNVLVLNAQMSVAKTDVQALENTLVNIMQLRETLEVQLMSHQPFNAIWSPSTLV